MAQLGVLMARHRYRVCAGWLIAVVISLFGLPYLLASISSPTIEVSGSQSQQAGEVLRAGMPSFGNEQMSAVLHSDTLRTMDPAFQAAIDAAMAAMENLDGISGAVLLPALLMTLTRWLEWQPGWMSRRAPLDDGGANGRLARWAKHLMRHPWPYAVAVTAGLLLAATPMPRMSLGFDAESRALAGTEFLTGVAIIDRDAPGMSSTVTILLSRPAGTDEPDTEPLLAALRADPEVAAVSTMDNGVDVTAVLAIPKHLPTSPKVVELVRRIRADIAPATAPPGLAWQVGGPSALISDILSEVSAKLWWVVGCVLALMFAVLVVVLGSLVLPVKAILMSLLATGASFGLTVLVFQREVGEHASGLANQGLIWPQVPLIVFVVLFGLSTDYELFLVRRIQEEYLATGDNRGSVAIGLQSTARSITLAAVILAVGFGSLLVSEINGLKTFGFAIAVALIIDATLIRLILVPAAMQIMGRWNWWFPSLPGAARRNRVSQPLPERVADPVAAS